MKYGDVLMLSTASVGLVVVGAYYYDPDVVHTVFFHFGMGVFLHATATEITARLVGVRAG